jgi:hypothetical protein
MNCAVVDQTSLIVINTIVADPAVDPAPDNCFLIVITPENPASIGWIYDPVTNTFSDPNPPPPPEEVVPTLVQEAAVLPPEEAAP